ncbi:mechanosensitive ion channel family protein [Pleurocapsa sp. PCC 7319]|uniref:mechanosensitive ion channel family protein n=1 Tax=Pleurocapsa sp. PCC 7319 TaxID=118161 RepID=UPI0003454B68|nr:mechanosensitive ion channel domain-containing protein [Pleurocapsa sp. PCC 7319]
MTPVSAQNNSFSIDQLLTFPIDNSTTETKAAIVIDEQEIFQVSGSTNLTAEDRADNINDILLEVINSSQPPQIEIKQRNKLPVIYLNNHHLLTVTSQDITKDNTVETQAITWKTELETKIKQAQFSRTPKYIREKSLLAVIILVVVFATDKVISLLKQYSLPKAIAKLLPGINPTHLESPNIGTLFKTKLILVRVILWSVTIYYLSGLFPQSRHWRSMIIEILRDIFEISFETSLFNLGDRSYSLIDLLILAGLFWGLLVATQTMTTLLRTRVLRQTRMSRGSQEVIFVVVKYGLISLGTIILLQVWGLNLSSIAILGSALGVGIGFGFQDIAKNFASGVVLLFERSVQIGDFIQVNGHKGLVERIQARSIVLKTLDHISIVVPNSRLLADEVINWSHDSPISRFVLPVGVIYDCDPEVVKEILLQVAKEHPEVLARPQPQVFFTGFGDSSLDFELLVWVAEPSRQPIIKSELYFRIYRILRDRAIEIPFPQRDLHLRSKLQLISPDLEAAFLRWLNNSSNRPSN